MKLNEGARVIRTLGLTLLAAGALAAQETDAPKPLAVGAMAPDFTLSGATRYGVLKNAIRLSDFKDKTVVIAFFYQARTRG